MEDYNDIKETEGNKKAFEIDLDNDFLLNESIEILSDFIIINKNIRQMPKKI